MNALYLLKCPVCGRNVVSDGKSLFCVGGERRHLFDFASSGYVNLLPPGRGKNARTGDDKSMISARARFLDKGYYFNVSNRIGNIISELAENTGKSEISFADCACGEGYHTCNILKTIAENRIDPTALAFDASKHGASYGARRAAKVKEENKAFFAAANIFSLPVKDSSVDFALSIFAPIAWDESKRILKDDGFLIVASSGEQHLFELRHALYDEPRSATGIVRVPDGFNVVSEETLSYTAKLVCNEDIMNLFYMTPFCYKTSKRDVEKLSSLDSLEVTVEVKLTVLKDSTIKGNLEGNL